MPDKTVDPAALTTGAGESVLGGERVWAVGGGNPRM